MRGRKKAAIAAGIGLALVVALFLWPAGGPDPAGRPRPAASYAAALARLETVRATETGELAPACRTILLDHGRRTARAFVFLHGFTNCPNQFLELARAVHAAGHNVLILRLPHHGHADRMTRALADLTASELAATADLGVDVGRGLGEDVTLVGLSVGAVAAAWAAQHRPDLDRAVLLAPSFGIASVPEACIAPLVKLLRVAPNRFWWWKPEEREQLAGPLLCYPRYSSRALAEGLRLGLAVRREARRAPTPGAAVVVVTNAADRAVSNRSTASLVRLWRERGSHVETYEFPAASGLGHDFIDPDQPYANTEFVYPKLLSLFGVAPDTTAGNPHPS